MAAQSDRSDYVVGRVYAVWVPSPFARVRPDTAQPVLRYRVCADAGDLANGGPREPVFVTTAEWATRAADSAGDAALAKLASLEEQIAQLGGVPECYSVKRAALFLDLSERTVYKLIHEGELRAFKVGGQHRIPSDALEELQQQRSAPQPEDQSAPGEPESKPAPLFNPKFGRVD